MLRGESGEQERALLKKAISPGEPVSGADIRGRRYPWQALVVMLCYALRPRVSPFGSCLFID